MTFDSYDTRTVLMLAPTLVVAALVSDTGARGPIAALVALAGTLIGYHCGKREA